ncbi:MAG: hypothetical protein KI786_14245 [Mameliella sp.]|nr:hypothetical protein [Phaeodactylibacter sp.]
MRFDQSSPKSLHWLVFTVLVCLSFSANAQKFEKEKRIKAVQMPQSALAYLNKNYPESGRIKHYLELSKHSNESTLQRFFESKFRSEGRRYSIKFDSLGRLYDVERIIDFKQLPSPVQQAIRGDLISVFQHFQILKIQEAFTPEMNLKGYELEVRCNRGKSIGLYEFQFDFNGVRKAMEAIEADPNPFFFF